MLSQLDKLVEPLEKTLTTKLKSDAVKQEVRQMAQWLVIIPILWHNNHRKFHSHRRQPSHEPCDVE